MAVTFSQHIEGRASDVRDLSSPIGQRENRKRITQHGKIAETVGKGWRFFEIYAAFQFGTQLTHPPSERG